MSTSQSFRHQSIPRKGQAKVPKVPLVKVPVGADSPKDFRTLVRETMNGLALQQRNTGNCQVLFPEHEATVIQIGERHGFETSDVTRTINRWLESNNWVRFDALQEKCTSRLDSAKKGSVVLTSGIRNAEKACQQYRLPAHRVEKLIQSALEEMGAKSEPAADKIWQEHVGHYLRTNGITKKYKKDDFADMLGMVTATGFDQDRASSKLTEHLMEQGLVLKSGWLF
jgi:hypothetical protein